MTQAPRFFAIPVLVLLLAGCATAQPDAAPSSSTPATTPIATTTPEPEQTADPAALTTEGYGYIRIGQPVPAQRDGAALVEWKPDACETFGAWIQAGTAAYEWDDSAEGRPSFVVDSTTDFTQNGALTALVVIDASGPRTDKGIAVGSTEAELTAAYPGLGVVLDLGDSGVQYSLAGTAGRLEFVVQGGAVTRIGVLAASIPAEFSGLGATDWYSPCS